MKKMLVALAVAAACVGCAEVPTSEPLADKALGEDCSLESRAHRAVMLTDLMQEIYGPGDLEGLHDATGRMERATDEAEMEKAARVYRLRFAIYISERARADLRAMQRESWEQIFEDLRQRTPELAAGLVAIRAEMQARCPAQ